MKNFLVILLFLTIAKSYSATCSNTTRTNYVTNQILTSSALNADFNQLVTKLNAFDGGCVTDGTLEIDALNSTDFDVLLKGIKEGCKVSYTNASTLSIGTCRASVNGEFVSKPTTTSVSMGCGSCSSEATGTTYYVYIATGSTGTTINPLILTTAPNEDGYDNSGNKVVARFYNDASSDIAQYSIDQWNGNQFLSDQAVKNYGVPKTKSCLYAFGGAGATLTNKVECTTGTCVEVVDTCGTVAPPAWVNIAIYNDLHFQAGTFAGGVPITCECYSFDTATTNVRQCLSYFITGQNTWETATDGSYRVRLISYDQLGTQSTGYVIARCEAQAP